MHSRSALTRFRPPGDGEMAVLFPEFANPGGGVIAGWAGSHETAGLRARASRAGVPFVLLSPAVLRAPPRGRRSPPCLSAFVCDAGGSGLSKPVATPGEVLAERGWETPALLAQAASTRQALVRARIGGEWWQGGAELLPAGGYAVVDLAVPAESRDSADPAAMLETALAECPSGQVVVLAPGPVGPRMKLWLLEAAARGAVVVTRRVDPWSLFDRAARVYTAGGELGFLALIAGIPVTAFGRAFYTGWGATEDGRGVPSQPFRRTADEIFAGACLVATRCRDPFHDRPASFREIVAILADWRRIEEANRRIAVCIGMSFWKRRRIADFVRSSTGAPAFRRGVSAALDAARGGSGAIAGWASRLPAGLAETAAREGVRLIRVEDGFIRSVGLGSDFLPPASLVFDSRGMYYDPRQPSELETLLGETEFEPDLIARATRLAALLVTRGITKYNLGGRGPRLDLPTGGKRILVPGQVEDDLSIEYGTGRVRTNLALLEAVRAADPDAFILYKPHPDVLAGHRKGAISPAAARRFADHVATDGSIAQLLGCVDEVHTMTSLAGFEALLRGRRVVVYGRPFYAGWGLTVDRMPCDRGRRLSLPELVAGVLILYPRYLDPLTRLPCGPEVVIERLDHPELWRPGPLVRARRLQGRIVRRLGELRAMVT